MAPTEFVQIVPRFQGLIMKQLKYVLTTDIDFAPKLNSNPVSQYLRDANSITVITGPLTNARHQQVRYTMTLVTESMSEKVWNHDFISFYTVKQHLHSIAE